MGTKTKHSQPGDETRLIHFSMRPSQWWRLLKLRRVVLTLQRQQSIDISRPLIVIHTDNSVQVLQYAQMLAYEDREDREAVSELAKLAGNKRNLEVAALGARQEGEHLESYRANLAHRLIQAASTDTQVSCIEDNERSILIDNDIFADLSFPERWKDIVDRQPCLSELADYYATQNYGSRSCRRHKIREKLVEYVGPQADTSDAVLRSRVAFETAIEYLMDIR